MKDYITEEAVLKRPDTWLDGTTNVLHYPNNDHHLKIILLRGHPQGRTLDAWLDVQTKELAKQTPFFEMMEQGERTLQNKRVLYQKCAAREKVGAMVQHRAAFQTGDVFVLLMTISLAVGEKESGAVFEHALATLKFREPSGS